MLKRSKFALVALLFATPLFLTSVVFGQTGTGDMPTTNTTGETTTQTETAPETPEQKTEREAFIKKHKELQKIRLTAAEKKKLQDKCKPAQAKVSGISGRLKGLETSRGQVHENLQNRLNKLVEKLQAKGISTTELEAAIATLVTNIETFNTDLDTYKQSVAALHLLDCQADPEGFKAMLLTSRTNLEKLHADSKAIHTYLNETIKPLLKTIRSQVEGGTTQKPAETESQGGTQ